MRRIAVKSNKSGMILLVVIAFILIMSIVVAGVFSRNLSTSLSATNEAKRIKAASLAKGASWVAHSQLMQDIPNSDTTCPPNLPSETIDGTTYSFSNECDFSAGKVTKVKVRVTYE